MQLNWAGRRVLIVEDNTIIAMPLISYFEVCGADVVGPASSLEAAFDALDRCDAIDAAVLDVELGCELVWPLAVELSERGIPFVFATGSADESIYPPALRQYPRIAKPYYESAVAASLHALVHDNQPARPGELFQFSS